MFDLDKMTSPRIKQTSLQQAHCKSALLSDQTKQARLHKHSGLALKAPSGASPLLAAQPPHHTTFHSSAALLKSSPAAIHH